MIDLDQVSELCVGQALAMRQEAHVARVVAQALVGVGEGLAVRRPDGPDNETVGVFARRHQSNDISSSSLLDPSRLGGPTCGRPRYLAKLK